MTRLTNPMIPAILFAVASLLVAGGLTDAKEVPGICAIVVTDTPPPVLAITSKCKVSASTKPYRYNVVNILDGGELIFDDANGTIDFWAKAIIVENRGKLTIGTPEVPIGSKDPKTVVTIHLYGPTTAPGAAAVPCNSSSGGGATCGAPLTLWEANVDANHNPKKPTECAKGATDFTSCVRRVQAVCDSLPAGKDKDDCNKYPGPKDDFFYAYHPLFHDDGDHGAYFGNKTIGVGYGGSLQLFGKKGACTSDCDKPQTTGQSWVRLTKTIGPTKDNTDAERTFTVSSPVDWKAGDQIVVTTTDYIPSHSERFTVASDTNNLTSVTVKEKIIWAHNGTTYPLSSASNLNPVLKDGGADVRAAVGLLSRNIRIVSGGAEFGNDLPTEASGECTGGESPKTNRCYFGGHVVIRQGFQQVQIQGAEFYQLGQGGRLAHYPIHFHHARRTPPDTYVVDSSVWDSMTRWIVLHGTQDVTLARNVGYLSIGHGYYLEDATEINNKLIANLGVFARAAVQGPDDTTKDGRGPNPRKVPGILAANNLVAPPAIEAVPFKSDFDHPTLFWIMNGWNDFQYNFAAGAGTCGVCYWLVPGANSTMSRNPQYDKDGTQTSGQKWDSYASMQSSLDRASMTPLKTFIGNTCSTAQMSFNTVGNVEPCPGVSDPSGDGFPVVKPIKNELSPTVNVVGPEGETPQQKSVRLRLDYYPSVDGGGGRFGTKCDGATTDCSATPDRCGSGAGLPACVITHLEQYTSSFTWAPFNFAALWLRPQWYLVSNSVISDIIMGGLNFVTGGGYTDSDRVTGHWALVRKSAFIGQTQPETSGYALDGGPFNPTSGLHCDVDTGFNRPGNRCTSIKDGVVFPVSNLGFSQRFFSVYDGPAFQESNAYFRIKSRTIGDCGPFQDANALVGRCDPFDLKTYRQSAWIAGFTLGLPKDKQNKCYMPNAAIGWKQPNGFYYPPSFHSANLYFNDVEYRHFVIEPLFKPDGTTDIGKTGTCPGADCKPTGRVAEDYCVYNEDLFLAFTDIDRQTVLNDDDGTLTGFKSPTDGTIAVNTDEFFKAPIQAIECASNNSAITSPYEYVTTVVYPGCATRPAADGVNCANPDDKGYSHLGDWDTPCSTPGCFGIPMSRLDGLKSDNGAVKTIRLLGQNVGQRSSLTVNGGTYYIDTTAGVQKAKTYCAGIKGVGGACAYTAFKPSSTYYLFQVYAKPTTKQTYKIYVGKGSTTYDPTNSNTVWMTRGNIAKKPIPFSDHLVLPTGWITGKNAYDPGSGILTVTVDLSTITSIGGKSLTALFKEARKNNCKPETYCTWVGGSDSDAGSCQDLFPLSNVEPGAKADTVCRWGVADMDCPDGGCIGIGFKTADTFKNSDDAGFAPPTPPASIPALCSTTAKKSPFDVPLVQVSAGNCPRLGPPPAGDDLALDFFDVTCVGVNCTCPK